MGLCSIDLDTFRYNIDSNLESMGMPIPADVFGSSLYVLAAVKLVDDALQ